MITAPHSPLQAHTRLEALQALLNPRFDGIAPETFDDWMPDIKDADLRAALLKNPRFQDRLTEHAYKKNNICTDLALGDYAQQDTLLNSLQTDPHDLVLRAGCVWQAGALAMAATHGQLTKIILDIPIETIRWVLKCTLNRDVRPRQSSDLFTQITIDGRLCVAAWFDTLPAQLRGRIALTSQLPQHLIAVQDQLSTLEQGDCDARIYAAMTCLAALKPESKHEPT